MYGTSSRLASHCQSIDKQFSKTANHRVSLFDDFAFGADAGKIERHRAHQPLQHGAQLTVSGPRRQHIRMCHVDAGRLVIDRRVGQKYQAMYRHEICSAPFHAMTIGVPHRRPPSLPPPIEPRSTTEQGGTDPYQDIGSLFQGVCDSSRSELTRINSLSVSCLRYHTDMRRKTGTMSRSDTLLLILSETLFARCIECNLFQATAPISSDPIRKPDHGYPLVHRSEAIGK